MITYGPSSSQRVTETGARVRRLDALIAELEKRRTILVEACPHHFTPVPGLLEKMQMTKVRGVYDAGGIDEMRENLGSVFFRIRCDCGAEQTVSTAHRCPFCASEVAGEPGKDEDRAKYFAAHEFSYHRLWLITCPVCGFRAAGLRWDK